MTDFLIFAILACITNAWMDAIDHGKGAERLGALWHILKPLWYIFVFMAGMSVISNNVLHDILVLIYYKWKFILFTLWGLWALWEGLYRLLRYIFKLFGIPKWF